MDLFLCDIDMETCVDLHVSRRLSVTPSLVCMYLIMSALHCYDIINNNNSYVAGYYNRHII